MTILSRPALALLAALGCIEAALADPQPGTGLQTSAAVDIVGQSGNAPESKSDRLDIREAELSLFAPIDHLFDGTLTAAAHNDEGKSFFEIHEAFVGSTKLVPRSRFRLGQFLLGVGRLNQTHRHDWPFVSAPRIHRELFGSETAIDSGLEVGSLLPASFYLDLSAGVTSGWKFGHAHSEGARPLVPTHYLRAATYLELPRSGGMQAGLNYLSRTDSSGAKRSYFGLDATAKWRQARILRTLLQTEIWYRTLAPAAGETENTLGAYLYPQYGFDNNVSFGLRFDYYSVLTLKDATGNKVDNGSVAVVPTLTYKSSEFMTLRLAYTRDWTNNPGQATQETGLVEVQATFILGAHPAHDF